MTETQRALALPNSAVLNMAPGANLPAYVQAVSGIAILSVERERELAERLVLRGMRRFGAGTGAGTPSLCCAYREELFRIRIGGGRPDSGRQCWPDESG